MSSAHSNPVMWRVFMLYLQEEDSEKYPNENELYHEAIIGARTELSKSLR